MPIEFVQLQDEPVPFESCPNCGVTPFEPFIRGCVHRPKRRWIFFGKKQDYCALICDKCKELVGYESPRKQ